MEMYNKAELARRYGCDPRTIGRYLKMQSGELKPKVSTSEYHSTLDDYKNDINHEVSQGSGKIPVESFEKEKKYFLPLPRMEILQKMLRAYSLHKRKNDHEG